MSMTAELGIEGALVVTSAGTREANVYVADGRITDVTPSRLPAANRFSATGLLLMPGMIDTHVHLMDPADPERESFPDGTAAALRSGVTSIVEHTHAQPVRTPADFDAKSAYLAGRSRVDFALAAHAWPGEVEAALECWSSGAAYIKVFTCTTHGVPGHDEENLRRLFTAGAREGAVFLVHCEDERLTAEAERRLRSSGRSDGGVIPEWRSVEAELAAVNLVGEVARQTGAKVGIAHASSAISVAAARRTGVAFVETCPQYLALLRDEVETLGALRKFTPPARATGDADFDALWAAVREQQVDLISSDHAPSTRNQKLSGDIWHVHFGLPGLDTTMGILLDAAAEGRIAYERLVELYSESPANIYGLASRKGTLATGADADMVLVDPNLRWTVTDEGVLSRAGWSPYSGRTLRGRAVRTYLRGELAMAEGEVLAPPGTGVLLRAGAVR